MRLLSAVAVSLFLLVSNASAATYYVATTGSDTAAGSLAAPFRTIKQATRVVRPGDVVNVRGGIYYETTHVWQVKGTAAAPIVIQAMAGEQVVLDGSKLAAGTAIMNFNQCEYIDFRGFEVRNGPYIGVNVWFGRNIRILDNYIHHIHRNAIYVGADTTPGVTDITVSGNEVHDSALENQTLSFINGGWPGAVVISHVERSTIERNKVYRNYGEGVITVSSNYATVRGNELFDNFSSQLYLDNARFVTADRNLIYSTGDLRFFRDGKPGVGMGVANEYKDVQNPSSDNTFTNNIVIGTRWAFYYGSFEVGGGLHNTKVLHNTFYGIATAAIVHVDDDTHSNAVIANNIFYQTGIFAPTFAGGGSVTWRNNLWHGGSAGAAAGTGDLHGNPLFVNPGGLTAADYKLRSLSPAIHTAADRKDVTTDYFGAARSAAADIGAHEESLSLGSSATVLPAPPTPSSVAARLAGNSHVRVSWERTLGALRYNVYRNGRFFDSVEKSELTDKSVLPATTYVYEIAGVDAAGTESARSAQATVTTPAAAQSAKPDAPQGANAVASSSRVTLTWTAVAGAATYNVVRNGVPLGETQSATYTDTAVEAATTYTYSIIAVTAAGDQSSASEKISVTTPAAARRRAVR